MTIYLKYKILFCRRVSLVLQTVRECISGAEKDDDVVFFKDHLYSNEFPDQPVDDGHYFKKVWKMVDSQYLLIFSPGKRSPENPQIKQNQPMQN